jgi:hypothetical protein
MPIIDLNFLCKGTVFQNIRLLIVVHCTTRKIDKQWMYIEDNLAMKL